MTACQMIELNILFGTVLTRSGLGQRDAEHLLNHRQELATSLGTLLGASVPPLAVLGRLAWHERQSLVPGTYYTIVTRLPKP
jgi:hypothetical protein